MLEARSLTKYYGHSAAVSGISFEISPGEILGYLGSNGAGKSTTVKMLTGLIQPSEGQILFNGQSVRGDLTGFQRRLGYVPEEAHLYPHLSGREYLQLVGRLRGIPHRVLEPKMDEFLRLFALWNDRHAQLGSYSKGMRQKILLAAALLHNPDVLILDEPFSGLDVSSALVLRDLLKALAQQQKIILFSSHVLETVEKVCSKVLILRKGKVAAYDHIDRLRDLMQQPSLEGVFSQLVEVESSERLVSGILDAMSFGTRDHYSPAGSLERKHKPLEPPVAFGLRVYRSLAATFPTEFQNAYGDELMQVTEEAIDLIWKRQGFRGLARLLLDIALRSPVEHLAELRQDFKYGVRALLASPAFTLVVLLSLSLGICVATCAFSEMNGMALRNLPGAGSPNELVMLQSPISYPMFHRVQDKHDLFSSAMAYAAPVPFAIKADGRNFRSWGHLISPTYFPTLGVHPALGNIFTGGEQPGNEARQLIVSYRFWHDHLGADPSVIGKSLIADGAVFTVRGVMPSDFLGASPLLFPADLWMPVAAGRDVAPELAGNALERRDLTMFFVVGRLRPG
ncbi:MAG: ATP-binding cassette domain-containing protein, partial [Acidobacteriaceae bacterium]|nr:ATP-binding cassette domain-containing protein [Acidobacteriaceae bacterium]